MSEESEKDHVGACKWIEGDDHIEKIRNGEDPFCGEPIVPGSSYCEPHKKRAFAKNQKRAFKQMVMIGEAVCAKMRRDSGYILSMDGIVS